MPRPHRTEALSDDARQTSDICLSVSLCLSVAYIGPNSRTERSRKTKIGTEVGHVTCDSDITFKVKRSKVNLQGAYTVAASRAACYCNNIYQFKTREEHQRICTYHATKSPNVREMLLSTPST